VVSAAHTAFLRQHPKTAREGRARTALFLWRARSHPALCPHTPLLFRTVAWNMRGQQRARRADGTNQTAADSASGAGLALAWRQATASAVFYPAADAAAGQRSNSTLACAADIHFCSANVSMHLLGTWRSTQNIVALSAERSVRQQRQNGAALWARVAPVGIQRTARRGVCDRKSGRKRTTSGIWLCGRHPFGRRCGWVSDGVSKPLRLAKTFC